MRWWCASVGGVAAWWNTGVDAAIAAFATMAALRRAQRVLLGVEAHIRGAAAGWEAGDAPGGSRRTMFCATLSWSEV